MSGLDAPWFRIEVVGAITNILHRSERDAFVGRGDEATWSVWGKHERFAAEVLKCLAIGKFHLWEMALRHVGREDFQFRVDSG